MPDLSNFSFQQEVDKRRRLSLFPGVNGGPRARSIRRTRTPSPKSTENRSRGYSIFRYSLKGNMVSLDDPLEDAHLVQVIRQCMLSSTDTEYFDLLIPAIKDACVQQREDGLMMALERFAEDKEAEIEQMCNENHQPFVQSVEQVLKVREESMKYTSEILKLNQTIQKSTESLAAKKKALVDSRGTRQNIDEAMQALHSSLEVLAAANRVHELLSEKKHYTALRTLDELHNIHLKEVMHFEVAKIIQSSVPAMKTMIKEAVMTDLNHWLYQIRETSKLLGQVAFDQTELRRERQKERAEKSQYFELFKLNSAVELVLDEREEFDVLNNENVMIDFTPLHECIHIHEALELRDDFRLEYSDVRRQQKELLLPVSVSFREDDISGLAQVLEEIAGFAIIERATMRRTQNFRSASDVEELWTSMCSKTIKIITPAMQEVNNSDTILKIKAILSLFIQTMDTWSYNVDILDAFLLKLFERYSELLKKQFSKDFVEIVQSDDYMPMAITDAEEYAKVINVSWFKDDRDAEEIQYPTVLPFSQMYPLCCIDLRSFLNKYYFFSREYFHHPHRIDETLRVSLDEMLMEQVCKSLHERLTSKYLGQIVQILINLEHFETACSELQILLRDVSASAHAGPVQLEALEMFRNEKKTAEKRIFELVNSKLDDLLEGAEYDWMPDTAEETASPYLLAMTRFLTDIMETTLLGLPNDIKGFVYFDALSHLASEILKLPLSEHVRMINKNAVKNMDQDVAYLEEFVKSLESEGSNLPRIFEELRETVNLLKSDNPEEFYDISVRMKHYTKVDPLNGPLLMEKLRLAEEHQKMPVPEVQEAPRGLLSGGFSRFRGN
ncbi:hypothetical protein TWF569_011312 [Orbilia oligospora]|uniref:Exocyst complex component SEC15 n=1 Tax=Orbilia oligospora TaxID=2813651 RepID=A0A7C8NA38_ORBOL|nr:hypothetical protein TWF706_001514 [Orbilia oligospora]KAF3091474.1 hypothetical protein TWF102_008762 [Orbilia oligospora]KAF3128458.1 hypothetical protein TWF703_009526 [Orbilia oligospora]KAF3154654.1 hypothetical protein TWF569_011312 [Orbilia oligospora]